MLVKRSPRQLVFPPRRAAASRSNPINTTRTAATGINVLRSLIGQATSSICVASPRPAASVRLWRLHPIHCQEPARLLEPSLASLASQTLMAEYSRRCVWALPPKDAGSEMRTSARTGDLRWAAEWLASHGLTYQGESCNIFASLSLVKAADVHSDAISAGFSVVGNTAPGIQRRRLRLRRYRNQSAVSSSSCTYRRQSRSYRPSSAWGCDTQEPVVRKAAM